MKLTQRLAAIWSVILACCVVVGGLLVLPTENALAQECVPIPEPDLSHGYEIPINPDDLSFCRDVNIGAFAWQTFVALNWPVDDTGAPLKDRDINDNLDHPRVWEYYKFPEQVFKDDEKESDRTLRFTEFGSKFDSNQKLRRTKLNIIQHFDSNGLDSGEDIFLEEGSKPLIDRMGNYILNEARMNSVEANQIRKEGWDSVNELISFANSSRSFELICSAKDDNGFYPNTSDSVTPCLAEGGNESEGSIEIKAAWMVLPDADTPLSPDLPNPAQYYTSQRELKVKTPEGETTVKVSVALVGFHILRKTSRNGWIWATFEHRENAPDDKDKDLFTDVHYNLYSPDCTEDCAVNTPQATEPYLWSHDFPHAVTKKEDGQIKPQKPSQITRLVPIQAQAQRLNSKWQEALKSSFWKNYQLIGVQWLGDPKVPYDEAQRNVRPRNEKLANVTLEPYVQKEELGKSCIACHTFAELPLPDSLPVVNADFSFFMQDEPS